MKTLISLILLLGSLQANASSFPRFAVPTDNLNLMVNQMASQYDEGVIQLTLRFKKDRSAVVRPYPVYPIWQYQAEREFNYRESLRLRRCC
jgi:hypothetical protein